MSSTFFSTTEALTPSAEVTAIQCTSLPALKACWKVVNGTKIVCGVAVALVAALAGAEDADHLELRRR